MDNETGNPGQESAATGSVQDHGIPPLALMPEGIEYSAVQGELAKQTERGKAILAGAFLEWRVRQAIERRFYRWDMPTGKKKAEAVGSKVFGTDETAGELGFSDQCKIAYCLGLVGPIAYRDLLRIARIRNRFAHHMEVTDFDCDRKVRELCMALETPETYEDRIRQLVGEQNKNEQRSGTFGPGICLHDGSHRGRYLFSVQTIWIMVYQVAAYFPVEWPAPELQIMYW